MKSSLKPADGKTKTYYGGWKTVFSGEIFYFINTLSENHDRETNQTAM